MPANLILDYYKNSCNPKEDISKNVIFINGDNKDEFVRYEGKDEIKFLKEQDWIIDYNDFINLSEDEIKEKALIVGKEITDICNKYNEEYKPKVKKKLFNRYEDLMNEFESIKEFLWYKQGKIKYDIPVVPSSEGFTFSGDDTGYIMSSSLDPNKILLYRKDGKPLDDKEEIPISFYQMGLSIATMKRSEEDYFYGDYETNNSLSEDKKYLIIEFKTTPVVEKKQTNTPKKEKGIKIRVKKWLRKGDK